MKKKSLTTIVILTFNNLEYNQECLQSIIQKTNDIDYEIIVVDNASDDGTREYLQGMSRLYPNIRTILNDKNLGFSKAINIGAAAARGDYLVFLNNDTVVTPGWLNGLVDYLADEQIGMVGPVTNGAVNETWIETSYERIEELDNFAKKITHDHVGKTFDIEMLPFMCVAIRRKLFEKIGPLDEQFGLGMFEDDDYAMRVRQQGYRVICAEDIYIHHHGGGSFLKLRSLDYWKLFWENRRKFEDKWKTKWTPHVPRPSLRTKYIIDLLEQIYGLQWDLANTKQLEQRNYWLEYELSLIKRSRIWKILQKMVTLRQTLIPHGTTREKALLATIRLLGMGKEETIDTFALPTSATNNPPEQDQTVAVSDEADFERTSNSQQEKLEPVGTEKVHHARHIESVQIEIHEPLVPILAPQFFDRTGDNIILGGAERYLVELLSVIQKLGHHPVVYQSADRDWARIYKDITVKGLDDGSDQEQLNALFHANLPEQAPAVYLGFYLAAPRCQAKSVGISHGIYWDINTGEELKYQIPRLEKIMRPFHNLSRVVSVDTNTINWVRTLNLDLASKFVYIPNFVNLEHFRPRRDRSSGDRVVVLFARRLCAPRGFWLVKALIPEFIEKYGNMDFHFVGQPEQAEAAAVNQLIETYQGRVKWTELPFDQMNEAYAGADISLIPTVHFEGTSLSCLESMASGNAIIATNIGGLTNLIIPGYNGLLINPTVDALRQALDMLMQNKEMRLEFGKMAVETAQVFNLKRWQDQWAHEFEWLMGNSPDTGYNKLSYEERN